MSAKDIENLKRIKYHIFEKKKKKKKLSLSIVYSKCGHTYEKTF